MNASVFSSALLLHNNWEGASLSQHKMVVMSGMFAVTAMRRCDKLLLTITEQMRAERFIHIPPRVTVSQQFPVISLLAIYGLKYKLGTETACSLMLFGFKAVVQ